MRNSFIALCFFLSACSTPKDQFYLVILAGQSNAEGMGLIADLPDSTPIVLSNTWIYAPNRLADFSEIKTSGFWQRLKLGFGSGYSVSNKENHFSDKFGPEIGFAQEWERLHPGKKLALFKYAQGGSSIHKEAAADYGSWDETETKSNGNNQLDFFLANIDSMLIKRDLNGDGKEDEIIPTAILWMQGESDASFSEEIANSYESNLTRLMQIFRTHLNEPELRIVIGEISASSTWEYGTAREHASIVRQAQQNFVKKDKNAKLVLFTKEAKLTDGWHYRAEDYLLLGKRFAQNVD